METFKILGQSAPAITTNTTVYTVPENTQTVVSMISVCNTNGTAKTVRIYVVPFQGSAAIGNAFYYDQTVQANGTITINGGITLRGGDFIVVYASATNVCFQVFGSEII